MEVLPSPFLASVDDELASLFGSSSSSGSDGAPIIDLEHPATVAATENELAGLLRTGEVHESLSGSSSPDATASREQPSGSNGNTLIDSPHEIPLSQPRGEEMEEVKTPAAKRSAGLDEDRAPATLSSEKTRTEAKEKMSMNKTSAVHAIKAMQAQLDEMENRPLCVKCRYPVQDVFRARKWGKQKDSQLPTFCCRVCNSAMTQISKKLNLAELDEAGLSLAALPASEIQAFYAKVYELHGENDELSWSTLKELLIETLTQNRLSSSRVRMRDEELPLSVWQTRGFDIIKIQESGTRTSHPVFGEVWSVPLRIKDKDEVSLIVSCCSHLQLVN